MWKRRRSGRRHPLGNKMGKRDVCQKPIFTTIAPRTRRKRVSLGSRTLKLSSTQRTYHGVLTPHLLPERGRAWPRPLGFQRLARKVSLQTPRAAFPALFPHREKEERGGEAGVAGWVPCACPAGGGPGAGPHLSAGIGGPQRRRGALALWPLTRANDLISWNFRFFSCNIWPIIPIPQGSCETKIVSTRRLPPCWVHGLCITTAMVTSEHRRTVYREGLPGEAGESRLL